MKNGIKIEQLNAGVLALTEAQRNFIDELNENVKLDNNSELYVLDRVDQLFVIFRLIVKDYKGNEVFNQKLILGIIEDAEEAASHINDTINALRWMNEYYDN